MEIVVFEDDYVSRLYPITVGRPAYAVTCGSFRLVDWLARLSRDRAADLRGIVRPHLAPIQRLDFPQFTRRSGKGDLPLLLVNARVVPSVGAYRLRYSVERERGLLDGGGLGSGGGFRYGLTGWVVEPIASQRGETAAAALAPNGEFRHLVDAIDPEHTVVTLWVYPDSFALYRQLRDLLHEKNIEVAGRPLPPSFPIASTRKGSASRGQ